MQPPKRKRPTALATDRRVSEGRRPAAVGPPPQAPQGAGAGVTHNMKTVCIYVYVMTRSTARSLSVPQGYSPAHITRVLPAPRTLPCACRLQESVQARHADMVNGGVEWEHPNLLPRVRCPHSLGTARHSTDACVRSDPTHATGWLLLLLHTRGVRTMQSAQHKTPRLHHPQTLPHTHTHTRLRPPRVVFSNPPPDAGLRVPQHRTGTQ